MFNHNRYRLEEEEEEEQEEVPQPSNWMGRRRWEEERSGCSVGGVWWPGKICTAEAGPV